MYSFNTVISLSLRLKCPDVAGCLGGSFLIQLQQSRVYLVRQFLLAASGGTVG
jgi:hypothetical protein